MKRIAWLTAVLATTLLAGSASAQLPVEFSERPLTLTEGTLNASGALIVKDLGSETGFSLGIGVSYGITDDFEVGATPANIALSPKAEYGNPSVWAAYRILRTAIEIAPQLALVLPAQSGTYLSIEPGFRFLAGLGSTTSLHWAVNFPIHLTSGDPYVDFAIPIQFRVNFTPQVYLHVDSGVTFSHFDSKQGSIPFGFGVGYTLANNDAPFIDFELGFRLPRFVQTSGVGDAVSADFWEIAASASFFFGAGAN